MSAYDNVFAMVEGWRESIVEPEGGGRLKRILENLRYLERIKFQPFVPTLYSRHPVSFMERFQAWLTNPGLSSEQQRDLFEFADHIAFFSFDDFTALFQTAFTGVITRWCMDQAGIRLNTPDWRSKLDEERYDKTWFCPITDSLLISVFHHVNEIEGKNRKPAFRELMFFGDKTVNPEENKIQKHIRDQGYKRLVLLEDFVGTGGQCYDPVKWAAKTIGLPVLFCPMITAPEARQKFRALEQELNTEREANSAISPFAVEPIFTLSQDCFVYDKSKDPEALFVRISQLANELHERLKEFSQECKEGPLGWWKDESLQKGATAVMFSNTPNNSLPLIHHEAKSWRPLFPRVARQPL